MHAQSADSTGDLMEELEGDTKSGKKQEVEYTFKATRLINGSTVENLAHGVLDTRISHRFGNLNQGAENFFGIDNAYTRIGIDYGITNRIMVGIGHNVLSKENDGFVKVKLLKQLEGGMPVTVSYFGSASVLTGDAIVPSSIDDDDFKYSDRLTFTHQLLIARKFSPSFSLQLTPTMLHLNLVDSSKYSNNIFALGVSGRMKLSKRVALTGEYFYRFTGMDNYYGGQKTYNSLSLGFDIETGGHVFQLHFTNSMGISERAVLAQTTDTWEKGGVRYGFNISRVFTILKPKEFKK
ncbi:MAG: hypothetical protein EBX41_07575 [Chitinophagia bacterium]|nr:hypothetical protein [Chitinophagia bacterium]